MNVREQVKKINDRYGDAISHHRKVIELLHECWENDLRAVRSTCKHKAGDMEGFTCKKCGEMLE